MLVDPAFDNRFGRFLRMEMDGTVGMNVVPAFDEVNFASSINVGLASPGFQSISNFDLLSVPPDMPFRKFYFAWYRVNTAYLLQGNIVFYNQNTAIGKLPFSFYDINLSSGVLGNVILPTRDFYNAETYCAATDTLGNFVPGKIRNTKTNTLSFQALSTFTDGGTLAQSNVVTSLVMNPQFVCVGADRIALEPAIKYFGPRYVGEASGPQEEFLMAACYSQNTPFTIN